MILAFADLTAAERTTVRQWQARRDIVQSYLNGPDPAADRVWFGRFAAEYDMRVLVGFHACPPIRSREVEESVELWAGGTPLSPCWMYVSPQHPEVGLIVEFCPWCGIDLRME